MAEQELDNLLIKVDSELGDLKGLDSAIGALQSLSKFTNDASSGIKQLGNLGKSFQNFNNLKLDGLTDASKGVNNLIDALDRLSKVGSVTKKTFNQFEQLGDSLRKSFSGLGTELKGIEQISTGVNDLVKALSSLAQAQGVTKSAIDNVGRLGDSLHHFKDIDKDIAKIVDPVRDLMSALGNLGNNNKISIRVDSNGVASVNKITKQTRKAISTWDEFEKTLNQDMQNLNLGSLFDISLPVEQLEKNLSVAKRSLTSFENSVRTNGERVKRDLSNYSFSDLQNDRGFRNAYRAEKMSEQLADAYRQGIPQLEKAIEDANTQAIEDAWQHTEDSITNDLATFNLGDLINVNLPLDDMKANLRTLQNELSRAQSAMQRAQENMRRISATTANQQDLRADSGYRQSYYTWKVNTEYVRQYQNAISQLDATVKQAELLPRSDVELLRQLPSLQEQLRRFSEAQATLLANPNLTDEQQAQLGIYENGLEIIRNRIQTINDQLEHLPQTEEGVLETMRQIADEAERTAKATAEAEQNLRNSVGNGFSQFGSALSGTGSQIAGSIGKLSSMFGGAVQSGAFSAETVAGLEGVAGALGAVATALGVVTAVMGLIVTQFKTWYNSMTQIEGALKRLVQRLYQFSKDMLSVVVGAFNSVAGAVDKVVSIVHSGAEAISSAVRKIGDVGREIISVFGNVGRAVSTAAKGFGKILSIVTPRAVKNIASYNGSLKDIVKNTRLLSKALQTVNKWFTMLTRMLMRKIVQQFISGLKQAFDDLVVYEKNANDEMMRFNENVSLIFSGLRRDANQWIAAFEPLVNALTPSIVSFLDGIQAMGENVAKFMAILTGQPYYIRAKRFYEDYGQNVEDTAKKVKNLTNGLDELNILNDSSSKDDSGISPEDMFEKVPIEGAFDGMLPALDDILGKIKDFLRGIDWDWLKEKVRGWVSWLFDIINEILHDKELWELLGKTVGEIINFLFEIINQAVHDLDWKALGQDIATFIKNALETIDWELIRDTVVTLAKGLADMWNEIFADKELWTDIGSTVAHIINDVIVAYLDTFAWTFDFSNMADSIALAIKTALENIDWTQIRHAVDGWTQGIVDVINTWASDKQLWTDIGNTIKHIINDIFINAFNDLGDIDFAELTDSLKIAITNALDINWDEFNEAVGKWAQNIADVINGIFGDEKFLTKITTSIANLANSLITGLDDIITKLNGYDIGAAITGAITTGLEKINWDTAFKLPADAINLISDAIRGMFDSLPEDVSLADWLVDHLKITFDNINWDEIKQNLRDAADAIVTFINDLIANDDFWDMAGKLTFGAIDLAIDLAFNILLNINWDDLAQRITDAVNNAINSGRIRQIIADLGEVLKNAIGTINVIVTGIDWSGLAQQIADGIADAIDTLYNDKDKIIETIENTFAALSEFIKTTLTTLIKRGSFRKLGTLAGELLLSIITGTANLLDENADLIIQALDDFTYKFSIFLKQHEKEIVDGLNRIIHSIVDIINAVLDDASLLHENLTDIIKQLDLGTLVGAIFKIIIKGISWGLEDREAIWEAIKDDLDGLVSEIWDALLELLGRAFEAWRSVDKPVISPFGLIKMLLGIGDDNKLDLSHLFDDVKLTGEDSAFSKLKDKVTGFFKDKFGKKDKEKVDVPVTVTPELDEDSASSWDDLFDKTKKVPIELEDPKLGTITASLIDADSMKATSLKVDDIFGKTLTLVDIFADTLHVGDIDGKLDGGIYRPDTLFAGNPATAVTGTISKDDTGKTVNQVVNNYNTTNNNYNSYYYGSGSGSVTGRDYSYSTTPIRSSSNVLSPIYGSSYNTIADRWSSMVGGMSASDWLKLDGYTSRTTGSKSSNSSNRARASSPNESYIWDALMDEIGNPYGVAGLMGNLFAESGLNPSNLQDSSNKKRGISDKEYVDLINGGGNFLDNAGFGLAQWTTSDRKQAYLDSLDGRSVDDLDAQIEYLIDELNGDYKKVLDELKKANSIAEASNAVLHGFEKPKDSSASMEELRKSYGEDFFNELAGDNPAVLGARREKEDITEGSDLTFDPKEFEKTLETLNWNEVLKEIDWESFGKRFGEEIDFSKLGDDLTFNPKELEKVLKALNWEDILKKIDWNKLLQNVDPNKIIDKINIEKYEDELGESLREHVKKALDDINWEELGKGFGDNPAVLGAKREKEDVAEGSNPTLDPKELEKVLNEIQWDELFNKIDWEILGKEFSKGIDFGDLGDALTFNPKELEKTLKALNWTKILQKIDWNKLLKNLDPNKIIDKINIEKYAEEFGKIFADYLKKALGEDIHHVSDETPSVLGARREKEEGKDEGIGNFDFPDDYISDYDIMIIRLRMDEVWTDTIDFLHKIEKTFESWSFANKFLPESDVQLIADRLFRVYQYLEKFIKRTVTALEELENKLKEIFEDLAEILEGSFEGIFDGLIEETEYAMAEVYDIVDRWLARLAQLLDSFKGILNITVNCEDALKDLDDFVRNAEAKLHLNTELVCNCNCKGGSNTLPNSGAGDNTHLDNNTNAKSKNTKAVEGLTRALDSFRDGFGSITCNCNCGGNCGSCPMGGSSTRSSSGGIGGSSSTGVSSGGSYTPPTNYSSGNTYDAISNNIKDSNLQDNTQAVKKLNDTLSIVWKQNGKSIPLYARINGQLVKLTKDMPDDIKRAVAMGLYPITDSKGNKVSANNKSDILKYLNGLGWLNGSSGTGTGSNSKSGTGTGSSSTGGGSKGVNYTPDRNYANNTSIADTGNVTNTNGNNTNNGGANTNTNNGNNGVTNTPNTSNNGGNNANNTNNGGNNNNNTGNENNGGNNPTNSDGADRSNWRVNDALTGEVRDGNGNHVGWNDGAWKDADGNTVFYKDNQQVSEEEYRQKLQEDAQKPENLKGVHSFDVSTGMERLYDENGNVIGEHYDPRFGGDGEEYWTGVLKEQHDAEVARAEELKKQQDEKVKQAQQKAEEARNANNQKIKAVVRSDDKDIEDAENAKVDTYRTQAKSLMDTINSKGSEEQKNLANYYYDRLMTNHGWSNAQGYEFDLNKIQEIANKSVLAGLGDLANARIGINGGVYSIDQIASWDNGLKVLATAVQSDRDRNGNLISWFSKGNGSANSANASDRITDEETINKIKDYIKKNYGITNSSENDLPKTTADATTSTGGTTATSSGTSTGGLAVGGGNVGDSITDSGTSTNNSPANQFIDSFKNNIDNGSEFRTGAGKSSQSSPFNTDLAKKIFDGSRDVSWVGYTTKNGVTIGSDNYKLASSAVKELYDYWYKNRFLVKGYQMGGTPNSGELFVARENGTPEFVGSFGNKTTVTNNDQIVTAVANGVSMANDSLRNAIENQTNVLQDAINSKELDVQIGDREIAEANRRGERNMGSNLVD